LALQSHRDDRRADERQHEHREQLRGMKCRPLKTRQHSPHAALAADILQERPHQSENGEREQQDDDRAKHPAQAVALDRDEQVALDDVAEHDAEDQWRARPFELLHDPADQTKKQQGKKIAPLPARLERADIDDAEHGRQDERVAQRREFGELRTECVAQAGAQDVC
jgi:hypothetical protein